MICGIKTVYNSMVEARRALGKIQQRRARKHEGAERTAYKCRYCGKYHVSSQKRRKGNGM